MAKAKKHTRKITVDGVQYHWKISQSASEYNNAYYHSIQTYIDFIVFTNSGNNQTLFCRVAETPYFIVTPRFVKACITDALALGWQPNEKGKDFRYEYTKPLPIHKQQSIGIDFNKETLEKAFIGKNDSFVLKTKLKKNIYGVYHWVVWVFTKIEHFDNVKPLFNEISEHKNIHLIEFDRNYDSYVNDYHVLITLDNGQAITINCHQIEHMYYSDDTLQNCEYLT